MNPAQSSTELTLAQPMGEVPAEVLSTLAEIGEEVNASLDLDVVLARTAALIKKHIDYEIFGVLLVEPGDRTLKHRFSIGHPPDLLPRTRSTSPVIAADLAGFLSMTTSCHIDSVMSNWADGNRFNFPSLAMGNAPGARRTRLLYMTIVI